MSLYYCTSILFNLSGSLVTNFFKYIIKGNFFKETQIDWKPRSDQQSLTVYLIIETIVPLQALRKRTCLCQILNFEVRSSWSFNKGKQWQLGCYDRSQNFTWSVVPCLKGNRGLLLMYSYDVSRIMKNLTVPKLFAHILLNVRCWYFH